MASAMPGPQAPGKLQLMQGRYGATMNDQRNFYSKQLAILGQSPIGQQAISQAEGNFGIKKSDWSLADMQEAVHVIMINNLVELLNQAEEETWYYDICPVREGDNALSYKVINTFFRPQPLEEAAPRTTPRNLDIQKTVGMQGLSRYMNGFQVDSETVLGGVEQGVEWFAERVSMMRLGQLETEKFWIIATLMDAHKVTRVRWNDYLRMVRRHGTIRNWMSHYIKTTFAACKDRAPIELMIDSSNADFRFDGVPVNGLVNIVHEHSLRLIAHNNTWYSDLSKGGRPEYVFDGAQALMSVRGQPVYATRNFMGGSGESLNPIGGVATIGLFYPMVDRFNSGAYTTDMRTVKITDVENNGMREIDILEAAWRTRRWDPVTKKLRSLVRADEWASAGPDLRNQIKGQVEDDAYHTYIERPAFSPDTPYLGPATHWGSVKVATLPTERFLEMARSVIASLPDSSEINTAVDEYARLVAQSATQKLDTKEMRDYLAALVNSADNYPDPVGCKPVNRLLKFPKSSANSRFADVNSTFANNSLDAIPAGFGTLAGMTYLSTNNKLKPELKARVDKIATGIEKLANALSDSFASSVLINPRYASIDMPYATAADMLTTMVLHPHRAVLMYRGKKGVGNAVEANAAALESANALYDMVEKFVEGADAETVGYAGTLKPAAGNSLKTLSKKSMAMVALLNFAKEGGAFTVNPFAKMGGVAGIPDDNVEPKMFGKALLAALGGTFSRNRVPYVQGLDRVRENFTELDEQYKASSAIGAGGGSVDDVMMITPLSLEPAHVKELANLVKNNPDDFAGWTVGKDKARDIPATPDELQAYAAAIGGARGGAMPAFGHVAGIRWGLTSAHSLGAIMHVGQMRDYLVGRGINVHTHEIKRASVSLAAAVSMSSARDGSRRRAILSSLRAGADADADEAAQPGPSSVGGFSADPSGDLQYYLGCVDPRIDYMFNTDFAQHWDEINSDAASSLEVIIARLYATSPTDWDQSMKPWAKRNIRLPTTVYLDRVIRVQTNPFIRVLPGERTMFLARNFQRTLQGTDQSLGIYGINYSVYAGTVILQENNIKVYHSFAPAGYISGGGAQWAEENNGIGLTATLVPTTTIPVAWSPLDDIRMEPAAGADIEALPTGSASIALFEALRRGRVSKSFAPIPHPDNKWGDAIHDPIVESYTRDTTMFRGDGSFTLHVASAGMLPTSWATDGLRAVLDGTAVTVDVPLSLQSKDQVPVSV